MAKKSNRPKIHLTCQVCKRRNYVTRRNTVNTTEKLELKRFCATCKVHTLHKETKLPNPKPR
ncbi:50S ribosomal protein L33 [Candidatus Berkelbacteria bacterium]|nr:50S ribosomal protein L33 [Candidatus Berkelbacteria bacterium]